jgi:hypothetical protein
MRTGAIVSGVSDHFELYRRSGDAPGCGPFPGSDFMSSAQAGPQADSVERLPLRTKFFFGIGSAAETIALFALGSYSMLFYNQILGLNAGLAGLAVSASLLLDGLADPIVGSLSDRTRSRFGRRHGYMYFAPIPIALCIIAVFHPPKGASDLVLPGGVRFVLLLNRALSDSEVAAVARWSWETHGVGLDLMNFSPGAWTGVSVGQVYWSPPAHMQPLSRRTVRFFIDITSTNATHRSIVRFGSSASESATRLQRR